MTEKVVSKTNKIIYFFVTTIFFIIFDFYFSNLILSTTINNFPTNPILDLVFVKNTGAAFSILENFSLLLITFSIIAILLVIAFVIKNVEKFSTFAFFWTSMLISGIYCNLYERIHFGYVRDFFKLNFIEFPIFNISDIFINIGVIAIIIIIIKNKYLKK